jgi:uncharacterized membrane protein YtjA (UPF0391 family)
MPTKALETLTGGFAPLPGFGDTMLSWAVTFLVIALIAALFGFGGVASTAVGFAQICFFVFLILFLISAVTGVMRRGRQ